MYSISFREMVLDDLPTFLEIRNLSNQYLHNNSTFSIDEATKWFKETQPKFFVIEIENKIVGYFRTSNWDTNSLYIGADIHPDFRDKGIGYQSYLMFIDFLKKKYSINKLKLEVLSTNKRAKHLYEKIGFSVIEIKRNDIFRDGEYIDNFVMELKI